MSDLEELNSIVDKKLEEAKQRLDRRLEFSKTHPRREAVEQAAREMYNEQVSKIKENNLENTNNKNHTIKPNIKFKP